jgi:hypothetical protein
VLLPFPAGFESLRRTSPVACPSAKDYKGTSVVAKSPCIIPARGVPVLYGTEKLTILENMFSFLIRGDWTVPN